MQRYTPSRKPYTASKKFDIGSTVEESEEYFEVKEERQI
jgi:hypothetical protein